MSTSSNRRPRIAISAGDPAGIGPDVVLALAERDWPADLVVIADRDMLAERAALLAREVTLVDYSNPPSTEAQRTISVGHATTNADPATSNVEPAKAGTDHPTLTILHQPLAVPAVPGTPDSRNAPAILAALDRAVLGCQQGEFAALVTAPVSKAVIANAGVPFTGHTEYLAARTGTDQVVMLLVAGNLRVAPATTHLPLSAVPAAITPARLETTLRILHTDLRQKFAIEQPRISVLGLNPHAGESGKLGREELDVITPVIEKLRAEGLAVTGPWPADTAFSPDRQQATDCYLAMYHDQGLPVLKFAGFGEAVNITLGLPIIRTSVDHGTAFEIAGSGRARPESLVAAIELAVDLAKKRDGESVPVNPVTV